VKALRRFLNRLFASATRRRDEARLREELEAHLQMQAAENIRAGMPPIEARRQAFSSSARLRQSRTATATSRDSHCSTNSFRTCDTRSGSSGTRLSSS
jgi:hypothetical protein